MPASNHEIASDLLCIQEQMSDLINQAEQLLRGSPEYAGAQGYWINHIKAALGGHGYRSMLSMTDTIEALESADEEEDEWSPLEGSEFE